MEIKSSKKIAFINAKYVLIVLLFFVSQMVFSQHKTRADRFFYKGDYINAAKYYEEQLETTYSKKAIENIAISYYNIFEYTDAAHF